MAPRSAQLSVAATLVSVIVWGAQASAAPVGEWDVAGQAEAIESARVAEHARGVGRVRADRPMAAPALLGEMPMGALNSVAYAAGYVYAGLGPRVLTIDVSDPGQPHQTAFSPALPDALRDMAIADEHLVVAAGAGGLHLYSLAQPDAPRHVGEVPGEVGAVAAVGGWAYVAAIDAAGTRSVNVVDVSQPSRPRLVASIAAPAGRLALNGNRLFVTLGEEGLALYDVSTPAAPRELGRYDSPGNALDVAVTSDGALAVVADKTALQLVDVSDPSQPTAGATYAPPQDQTCWFYVRPEDCRTVERVRVVGQRVYVMLHRCDEAFSCRAAGGLRVVDISQPDAPTELASYTSRGNPSALAAVPGGVYLAERATWWYGGIAPCMLSEGSLQIFTDDAAPIAVFTPLTNPASLFLTPGRAWLADPIADLGVLDLSDPASPQPIAPDRDEQYFGFGYGQSAATDVWVTDELALVTIGPGYGAGAWLARTPLPTTAHRAAPAGPLNGCAPPPEEQWFTRVVANGAHAFLLDASGALQVKPLGRRSASGAVRAPSLPRPVAELDGRPLGEDGVTAQPESWSEGIDLVGPTVYLAGTPGLVVIDVSDPAAPRPVADVPLPAPGVDVSVLSGAAYVAAGESGVFVVDVRQPAAPRLVRTLQVNGAVDVAAAGTRLYVAADVGGLRVFDVTEPRRPIEIAALGWLYGARKVAVTDGLVGVLTGGGMTILSGESLPTPPSPTPTDGPSRTPTAATPTPTPSPSPTTPVALAPGKVLLPRLQQH